MEEDDFFIFEDGFPYIIETVAIWGEGIGNPDVSIFIRWACGDGNGIAVNSAAGECCFEEIRTFLINGDDTVVAAIVPLIIREHKGIGVKEDGLIEVVAEGVSNTDIGIFTDVELDVWDAVYGYGDAVGEGLALVGDGEGIDAGLVDGDGIGGIACVPQVGVKGRGDGEGKALSFAESSVSGERKGLKGERMYGDGIGECAAAIGYAFDPVFAGVGDENGRRIDGACAPDDRVVSLRSEQRIRELLRAECSIVSEMRWVQIKRCK